MNGKTYYMILGVSRAESAGGIRAAYRELAKKLHPDVPMPAAPIARAPMSIFGAVESFVRRSRQCTTGFSATSPASGSRSPSISKA